MKRKREYRVWSITIEGHPVDGCIYSTRKGAIDAFMENESSWTWKDYQRESNYKVERMLLVPRKVRTATD